MATRQHRTVLYVVSALCLVLALPVSKAVAGSKHIPHQPPRFAYLHVLQDGTVDRSRTWNVNHVDTEDNGIYCVEVAFEPNTVVATMSDGLSGFHGEAVYAAIQPSSVACRDQRQNAVILTTLGGHGSPGVSFYAEFSG